VKILGATLRNILKDPLPDKLFVDTNFFMSMVFSENPTKDSACKNFLKRLRDHTENNPKFVVAFNTIVYYEMYIALANNQLSKHRMSKKVIISNPERLKPFIPAIKKQYELFLELIEGFRKLEFSVKDNRLLGGVLEAQTMYKLNCADAFHLGTMIFAGEKDFASFDVGDFRQIPGINLWCVY
jgi:predicted nucleic acid-binding protein